MYININVCIVVHRRSHAFLLKGVFRFHASAKAEPGWLFPTIFILQLTGGIHDLARRFKLGYAT